MVKLGTFSITSHYLSHLFRSFFLIHITFRIFSLCKLLKLHVSTFSRKQAIFLVGVIMQKYSCHFNNCLSDLFYLRIQKYLMFEVFTSNTITVRQAKKQGTFGIYICTYTIHSFKTTKRIYRTCFHFLLFLT